MVFGSRISCHQWQRGWEQKGSFQSCAMGSIFFTQIFNLDSIHLQRTNVGFGIKHRCISCPLGSNPGCWLSLFPTMCIYGLKSMKIEFLKGQQHFIHMGFIFLLAQKVAILWPNSKCAFIISKFIIFQQFQMYQTTYFFSFTLHLIT